MTRTTQKVDPFYFGTWEPGTIHYALIHLALDANQPLNLFLPNFGEHPKDIPTVSAYFSEQLEAAIKEKNQAEAMEKAKQL